MSLTGIFSNFYLNSDSDNLIAININEATSVMFCIIILNSFPEPKYDWFDCTIFSIYKYVDCILYSRAQIYGINSEDDIVALPLPNNN